MESLGKTEAIYQKHDAQLTATSTVLACLPFVDLGDELKTLFKGAAEDAYVVATSETVFYAQGGGQPADVGVMRIAHSGESEDSPIFKVSAVRRAPSGAILHLGLSENGLLKKGDSVHQEVDGDTRRLHSRIHDGGHVVGLAVRRLADSIGEVTELKAQHFPESSFVEFQGLIDGKHKADIEAAANAMIEQDLPIKVCWWSKDELVDKCWSVPEALRIPDGELGRAVEIEGAGAYPCGGTHMGTTREVGPIQIRKISRQKGISKVSYCLR